MTSERRRLFLVLLLTLLPWPAVWLGMYALHSLLLTFVLYHGICLLPVAVIGRKLWLPAWRPPTPGQWLAVVAAMVVAIPLFLLGYAWFGRWIIDTQSLQAVVTTRGFTRSSLVPLGVYFVPVNAVLEELFWRGVILNELRGMAESIWIFGVIWTAVTFAAWHWMVLRLLLRPGWSELAVVGIVVAGIFFSWLYRRTQSIVVPILWHGLVFDLSLILVFAAALRPKIGLL